MFKSVPLMVLILACGFARAGWIEDHVSVDIDTEDPKAIATTLTQFQDALNYLAAENLTSPSRLRVKRFVGKIATYHWENDDLCAVKDPSTLAPAKMSTARAEFYYEAAPATVWTVDVVNSASDPCRPTHLGRRTIDIRRHKK